MELDKLILQFIKKNNPVKIVGKNVELGRVQKNHRKFKDKSKVCIHINKTSTSKPVNLYTNMDAKDLAENDTEAASGEKQFVCCNTKDYSNYFKVNGNPIGVEAYPEEYFKSVSEEENHEDRYYTVSVHMTEVDNTTNTIVLNGAKGEY